VPGRAWALAVLLLLSTLTGALAAQGARTADSDNSFQAASALSASGSRPESLALADDRSDFFKLDAASGQIIWAFIYIVEWNKAAPDAVNFSLLLYDRDRKQVAASLSNFQYETVSALAVATGAYYLEARTENGSGSYVLNWSVGAAQVIKDGDEIHDVLSDSGNRNANWYRVQLRGGPQPDLFKATLHEDAGAFFDLYFMDLWAEYSLWYDISWWSDPDESVEAQATYGGWYYLWVSDYTGKGNYTLNVTVTPGAGDGDSEPAGARMVPYNSSFYDRVDMAYDHYDWYKCELSAGETVKAVLRLDPAPADMFALSVHGADLSTLEGGMRTNYVDGTPPRLDRTVTVEKVVAAAGTYYVVVMARVGLRDTIKDLSDKNARSDYMLAVNLSAHPPGPTNHAPRALTAGATAAFDANTTYELDLAALFSDPDGDTLRYAASGNGSVGVDLSKAGKALLVPDEYYVGRVNFTLNATDPEGLNASVWVDVLVRKVPFPPVIFDRTPSSANISGVNGTTASFSVSARDPNHQMLTYIWSVNGVDLAVSANVLDWKVPGPTGAYVIRCRVTNADGTASTSWNLTATPKPPLRVNVITPLNNTAVKEGEKVTFYAVVPGLPPAELAKLTFSWSLRGTLLSSLPQFSTSTLPPGESKIKIEVTNTADPAEKGTASVTVFVEENEAQTDYTMIFLAVGILAVAAAAVGYFVYSRGARRTDAAEDEGERDPRRSRKKTDRDEIRRKKRRRR